MKKSPKLKKFQVSFEIDTIPYNKSTSKYLGPHFFKEWPDTIFAKEDLGEFIRNANYGLFQKRMLMIGAGKQENDPIFKEYDRQEKIIDQISNTLKVESI